MSTEDGGKVAFDNTEAIIRRRIEMSKAVSDSGVE
jgi:hypothetical protein